MYKKFYTENPQKKFSKKTERKNKSTPLPQNMKSQTELNKKVLSRIYNNCIKFISGTEYIILLVIF